MVRQKRWIEERVRPLVLSAMVGALALSLVAVVQLFSPTWDGRFLIALLMLVPLEATLSHRLIQANELRGRERLSFRVIELATLFIAARLVAAMSSGWAGALAEMQYLAQHPLDLIADGETLGIFLLAYVTWDASNQTLQDFDTLDGPAMPHADDASFNRRHEDALAYQFDRQENRQAMDNLAQRFLRGGLLLLLLAGVARIGLAEMLTFRAVRTPVRGLLLNVLFYFLTGLLMLGLARYSNLRRLWRVERVHISDELRGRWVRYTATLVGLAMVVAFLLPTGYSVGLLELGNVLLNGLLSFIIFVALLLFLLVSFPFAWLIWFLTTLLGSESTPPQFNPPPLPAAVAPPPSVAALPGWYEVIRSLLVWAVLLGILGFVLRAYLRDHPQLVETMLAFAPLRLLRRGWTRLRGWLRRWAHAGRTLQARRLHPVSRAPGSVAGGLRRRRAPRTPRERVIFYYLSLLRRAHEQGLPRPRSQTPYEFDPTLEGALPDAADEVAGLTDAFVEARYSPHPIAPEAEATARSAWQRIRAALRALREGAPKT